MVLLTREAGKNDKLAQQLLQLRKEKMKSDTSVEVEMFELPLIQVRERIIVIL